MAQKGSVNEDGRVFEIRDVKLTEHYSNPDYPYEFERLAKLSDTAEWFLFLFMRRGGGPWFRGRWDEDKETIDVDIFDVAAPEKLTFTRGDTKYGHHTIQGSDATRYRFHLNIAIPHGERVFEGDITFTVFRKFASSDQASMSSVEKSTVVKIDGDVPRA
ncbi:MAG: hypothetical protein KIT09_30340 [Bryobacteraceae bacterium]|nr:hypothetical protein [Bryobacteraceae bacterium]